MELTAEMVVDGHLPSSPALSPDGRWVVYVVAPVGRAGEHPSSRLWVTAVDGCASPWPLDVPRSHLAAPRWSADSGSIFFLSDHRVRGTAQLHRVGRTGRSPRTLTRWEAGLQDHRPLVDPALVAFLAVDEPTAEERRRERERNDAVVRGRPRPARLRLLDLRTGRIRTPARFGDRHVVEVVQRPDGGPLAVLTWSSPDLDPGLLDPALHLLDPHSGRVRDLGPVPADAHSPVWWRARDWHLAHLALTPPGLQAGTAVFDLVPDAGPAGAHRNLTAGTAACPVELVQVDRGAPLVLVADGLDTAVHRIVPGGLVEVSRTSGPVAQLSTNPSGDVVAAVLSGPDEPPDVHAGPVEGPLTRRSDTRHELGAVRWGDQQRLAYRASDGLALDGLLVLPPGRSRRDGPFPLVTLPHGGPYDRYADGFTLSWWPSGQWLAAAGYAVFLPNPRGGQGHGHDFAARVAGAVGQREWTDVLTGIDLLVADGVADPARLGIGGWSHGGFLAAWAVGQTGRFAAALVGAGISDWGLQVAAGEWGAFEAALSGSSGWEGPGPHPHDRLSPISYASAVRTPVLIVHGAEDTNVPLAQAEYLHRALRRYGVEHEFVVYPREGHSLRERHHQLDLLRRTRAWFDRWLGPPDRPACPPAAGNAPARDPSAVSHPSDDSTAVEPRPAPDAEPPPDSSPDPGPGWRSALVDAGRRAYPPVLAAVGLLVLLVGIGRLITDTGFGAAVGDADIAVLQWTAGLRTPGLDTASVSLSNVASTNAVLVTGLLVAVAASALLRRWWPAVLMAAALLGELVIFLNSATLVGRPRPAVPHLDPALPPTTSFPSGHTAAATCLYGGLAAIVLVASRGWWRWLVLALAVLAVLAVAASRVYRAAHHPSDVLGGALLGVLWLVVVTRAVRPRPFPVSPG